MKANCGITFTEGSNYKDKGPKYENINKLSIIEYQNLNNL